MHKPKVVFITPGLGMGGAERWIVTLAKFFKKIEPKCIINLSGKSDEKLKEEAKLATKVIDGNPKINYFLIKEQCSDVDALICWGCPNLKILTRDLTCKVIDVSHSDPIWVNHKSLINRSSLGATHHVGVSKTAAKAFPEQFIPKVIYNGIDPNRVFPKNNRQKKREEWKLKDEKIALFLGRLSNEKNPLVLVEATKYLPDNWKTLFIANGPLLDQIKENDKIKLIPKNMNIADLMEAADVLVLPSLYEGMPLVLIEGWVAGIPTVTTQYSTYKELTQLHGELSWSVPVEPNPKELATAIENADKAGRLSEKVINAKKIALEYYVSDKMVENWENYILSIL